MKKQSKVSKKPNKPQRKQTAPQKQSSFQLNAFTVTMLVIGSFLVSILLYIGLIWLIEFSDSGSSTADFTSADAVILLIVLGLIFGPGLIAAAIVLMMMKSRKN